MSIPAPSVPLPIASGRTLRTVAQSSAGRNFLTVLGVVAACVINGDTVSGILKQSTWLVVVITVLTVVRTVEALVRRRTTEDETADISD